MLLEIQAQSSCTFIRSQNWKVEVPGLKHLSDDQVRVIKPSGGPKYCPSAQVTPQTLYRNGVAGQASQEAEDKTLEIPWNVISASWTMTGNSRGSDRATMKDGAGER